MTFVGDAVCCDVLPGAIWYIPRKYCLGKWRCLVFGANSALTDIVCNVCVYARSIHSFSCLSLHSINTLKCSMQISKGPFEEFWWNATPCPLEEKASVNGQLISSAPEMSGNVKEILNSIWPPSKG